MVQLHGDEPPAYARALRSPIFRSVTLDDGRRRATTWPAGDDAAARRDRPDRRGGTGRRWTGRGGGVARRRRVVLAGGLTPDNVGEAIVTRAAVRRGCVVGRRSAPGREGRDKVDAFSGERAGVRSTRTGLRRRRQQRHRLFGRRDPDARGYFGAYGGRFVPETLVAPIEELTAGYLAARADRRFAPSSIGCSSTTSGGRRRSMKRARLCRGKRWHTVCESSSSAKT